MKVSRPVMPLPRRSLPAMAKVRQKLPSDHIPDVRNDVSQKLLASGLREKVQRGNRIAITAGSRGIGAFVELLAGIADAVKACGGEPFIIPAMGSHGGATPDGQTEILHRLGVNERSVGAPIRATMETQELGLAENGAMAHLDRFAAEADGILVLGRTKTHPESVGELASGLLKMCTIGLGKQTGAHQAHSHGLWDSVRAVPKVQLANSKILFGVAVVENGYRQPCAIEVVPPSYDAFLESDMRLLKLAKTHLARIPFDELDLLVVDELGKTISGGGMDPNIIGLWRNSDAPHHPNYKRIVVLSLTHGSLGNGLGIGMADFTTRRFVESYDPAVSYVNLLTASEPGGNTREGPLPLALDSDREAIEVGLFSSLAGAAPRICRIKNTALLDEVWASEALLDQVKANPNLEILQPPSLVEFNSAENLF
jgi:hypothetical protein